ncbi:unnamed protein product [Rotaria sordida]|nr:unnamed protein product [Rotaria sordida]CAF1045871.1 unnamed protein product [Rotaria sordida]
MNTSSEKKDSNKTKPSSAILIDEPIRMQPAHVRIPHHFLFSLISTICLCPATGLIALAYSIKSSAKADVNFHDKARRYSRYALIWNIISVIFVIALTIFTVFVYYGTDKMKTVYFDPTYYQQRYSDVHKSIKSMMKT